MRVLGIDPGLGTTGYAVVDLDGAAPRLVEAGAIRAKDTDPLPQRLLTVRTDVAEVLAEFRPDVMALESLFSTYKHPRSALQMAHVRGIVCLVAAEAGLQVVDIAPAAVKNAVVGEGRASKEQVRATVTTMYRLDELPNPLDVSDAIAIATAVAYRLARPGLPVPTR